MYALCFTLHVRKPKLLTNMSNATAQMTSTEVRKTKMKQEKNQGSSETYIMTLYLLCISAIGTLAQ